jgi:hypothetical protein
MSEWTREEHIAWSKQRALEVLASGDPAGAVASMISDLEKGGDRVIDTMMLAFLSLDGMMFCKTPDQVKHWIEGFD